MRGCLCGQFGAGSDTELGEDVGQVHFDGAGAMNSRRAIASFRRPSLTRRTTSRSAGVRLAQPVAGRLRPPPLRVAYPMSLF